MNKNVKIAKQLVKIAKSLMADKVVCRLPKKLHPDDFFMDYIRDNFVFENMPKQCWDYVQDNIDEVYEKAKSLYGDEWEVTQKAVRYVLNYNGLDGSSW